MTDLLRAAGPYVLAGWAVVAVVVMSALICGSRADDLLDDAARVPGTPAPSPAAPGGEDFMAPWDIEAEWAQATWALPR